MGSGCFRGKVDGLPTRHPEIAVTEHRGQHPVVDGATNFAEHPVVDGDDAPRADPAREGDRGAEVEPGAGDGKQEGVDSYVDLGEGVARVEDPTIELGSPRSRVTAGRVNLVVHQRQRIDLDASEGELLAA